MYPWQASSSPKCAGMTSGFSLSMRVRPAPSRDSVTASAWFRLTTSTSTMPRRADMRFCMFSSYAASIRTELKQFITTAPRSWPIDSLNWLSLCTPETTQTPYFRSVVSWSSSLMSPRV